MARTEAQKRAVAAFEKRLAESRRKLGLPSGGSSSRGLKTGTKGSTTLYYITDPKTGKVTVTGSPELAGTSYSGGASVQAGRNYGRSGRSRYNPKTAYDAAAAARIAAEKRRKEEELKKAADKFAAKVASQKAKAELNRISAIRSNIIARKGRINERTLIDSKTRDKIEVTSYRQGKDYVQRRYNTKTGEITFHAYGVGRGGGARRKTSVTLGGKPLVKDSAVNVASRYQIRQSNTPGYKLVKAPNGRIFRVKATGKVKVGSALAGSNLLFEDGKIISVDGKTTYARDEYRRPEPEVQLRAKEDKTTARWSRNIKDLRNEISTQRARGNITGINEAKLLGWAFLGTLLDGGRALAGMPKAVVNIIKNPSTLKQLPAGISRAGKDFGILLQTSPSEAFGVIGGEVVMLYGSNFAIKQVGNLSSRVLTRLNPKYVGKAAIGKNLNIKTGGGKSVNLEVVGKIPKEKMLSQVNKQGKKLSAISSQADDIILRQKQRGLIRKPIPGESGFNSATKRLLKKFDDGVITKGELFDLDLMVRSQGAKGLLERTHFADPTGKIRPSRLAVDSKKAGLMDYLSGDITFRKAKPQIFLYEDIKISKFPSYLKKVASKIKARKTLTRAEANAFLEWQLKQTGKFKPVGFISGESEIVLAPGEIIKKVKTVGVTSIKGKRVPIVKVEVLKQSKVLKSLLKKLDDGVITATERAKLQRMLKTQTGFDYGLSSNRVVSAKYVPIRRIGASLLPSIASKLKSGKVYKKLTSKPRLYSRSGKSLRTYKKVTSKSPKKISRKGSPKSPGKSSPKKTSKRGSPKSPGKGSPRLRPRSPAKSPPKVPVVKLPKGFSRNSFNWSFLNDSSLYKLFGFNYFGFFLNYSLSFSSHSSSL
jgi:hypothetical protein